ncbi:MAG: hypothetical protein QM775_34220 [Pirellulales bacterium]
MEFIQLSTKALPSAPSADTLFACLAKVASGGPYRLALLTFRPGNADRPIHVLLKSMGFELSEAFSGAALPAGWQFLVSADTAAAPISSISEATLDTFLSFGALTADGNLQTPATLAVNVSDFRSTWRTGARWFDRELFDFVDFDQGASIFAWSEEGATGDGVCSPNFSLRHQDVPASIGGIEVALPQLRYTVDLVPQADGPSQWNGAILNLETTNVGKLAFDVPVDVSSDLQLVIASDGRIHLHRSLDADLTLTLIGPDTVQLILSKDLFRLSFTARFGGLRATQVLLTNDAPLTCHVRLMTHLLMAATVPLPVIVPTALLQGSAFAPAVQFELIAMLDSAWDRERHPILELEGQNLLHRVWAFTDVFLKGTNGLLKPDFTVQFPDSITANLPGLRFSLEALLGQGSSDTQSRVDLSITPGLGRGSFRSSIEADNSLFVPMLVRLAVRPPGATDTEVIQVIVATRIILKGNPAQAFRLSANKWYFRLVGPPAGDAITVFDLHAFAVLISNPPFDWDSEAADAENVFSVAQCHGWLDIEKREFVLSPPNPSDGLPKPQLVFPGNIREADGSIRSLENRIFLEFEQLDPETWPNNGPHPLYLRINGGGLSLHAKVLPEINATLAPKTEETFDVVDLKPVPERRGVSSELVIIDNRLRAALLFGEVKVPGCKDLIAAVEVGLRQDQLGQVPKVIAKVALEREKGGALVEMQAGFLDFRCDDLEFILEWHLGRRDWDLSVLASGSMSFGGALANAGGLDELRRDNAIVVRDLNLLEMHKGNFSVGAGLTLDKPVEFNILDGLFGVTLRDLKISWTAEFEGSGADRKFKPGVLQLSCSTAEFRYRDPGVLEVQVEAGGVAIDFNVSGGFKATLRMPNRLGLAVRIGPAARFRGEIAWVDEPTERYFAAAGSLQLEGMPEVAGLLKIGTGVKSNGRTVPNIVVFAGMDVDVTLFPAVVVKNLAGGIGINNRLTGIGTTPDAEEILRNIDQIHPERIDGWTFVRDGDFYLSIVASAILASTSGGTDTPNAYVASIIFSLDTDLRAVAAGRLWLSSSVDFVRQPANRDRPALIGTMVFSPRNRTISVALQLRKNPAIENNPLFEKILNKGSIRLAFLISPSLVDYHLKEVSYADEFLGVQAEFRGSFRVAVFDAAVFIRQSLGIKGSFEKELSGGAGGFSAHGDLSVAAEYAGIISADGVTAYAFLDASLRLRVSAFIEIEFSIGSGRFKRSWSKTFRLGERSLELGLSGQAAFNESGEFGFSGSLSISTSICGYRLSISPSFAIRQEVVDDVRARIGEFEQRIEAFRRELLGGSRRSFALAASESWLHYRSDPFADETGNSRRKHLFVPAAGDEWFAPLRILADDETTVVAFPKGVTTITVTLVGGAEHVMLMPWDKSHLPADDSDSRNLIVDLMVSSGVKPTGDSAFADRLARRHAENYRPIRDPRVLSDSREFWKQADRHSLPSFALPVDMLSVDEVLAESDTRLPSSGALRGVQEYEFYRRRKDRLRKHQSFALDEVEKLQQTRGGIVQLLIQDLRRPGPSESFPAPQASGSPTLGLLLDLPASAVVDTIKVVRYDDAGANPAEVLVALSPAVPPENERIESRIQLLRPRQKFVPSGIVDPAADQVDGTIVVKIPLFLSDELLQRLLPRLGHFQVFRQIGEEGELVPIADFAYPDLTYLDERREGDQDDAVVLVAPYLATDSFVTAALDGLGIVPGATKIRYALRHVAPGSDSGEGGRILFGPSFQIHVPRVNRFPDDLVMVAPASALYLNNPTLGQFALASFQDGALQIAAFEKRGPDDKPPSLTLRDFELWVERSTDAGAGFFWGGEQVETDVAAPRRPVDPKRLGEAETTQGRGDKVKVDIDAVGDNFKFRDPALLDPRFGHQFFVRDASRPEVEAFIPLPLQLVREFPAVDVMQADDVDPNVKRKSGAKSCGRSKFRAGNGSIPIW